MTDSLTDDERTWLTHAEALWRAAEQIAAANPGRDVGTVYHTLRNVDLAPAERLLRGLTRVRRTRTHVR